MHDFEVDPDREQRYTAQHARWDARTLAAEAHSPEDEITR